MCLLLFSKDGRPKVEYIENSAESNPDGIGVAWKEDGYLRYEKGLSLDDAKKASQELPLGYVMHFRLASVGGKDEQLIHPFPVRMNVPLQKRGKANKLLFHNGHWSDWQKSLLNHLSSKIILPEGIWSDTRAIALLTAIHGKPFLKLITNGTAGNYAGKFILMTPTKTSVIGHFETEEGVYYSNSGYKGRGTSSYHHHSYQENRTWDKDRGCYVYKDGTSSRHHRTIYP